MFRKEALAMVAELCGCPASHSCVIVNAEADMAFCEGEGPAVIAMIRSDHSFSKEKNPVLFLKANEFFQKSLGANKERIYVEFFERDPDFCSVAGISMTEAMEQFKAMAQSG